MAKRKKKKQGKLRLDQELAALGWTKDADSFRDVIWTTFRSKFPSLTDEQLLEEPADAARFCDLVRTKLKLAAIGDSLICRTLLNIRKRGVRK